MFVKEVDEGPKAKGTGQRSPAHDAAQQERQQRERAVHRDAAPEIGNFGQPVIQRQGRDRIIVELPGVKDPEQAIAMLGKTAMLEFKVI